MRELDEFHTFNGQEQVGISIPFVDFIRAVAFTHSKKRVTAQMIHSPSNPQYLALLTKHLHTKSDPCRNRSGVLFGGLPILGFLSIRPRDLCEFHFNDLFQYTGATQNLPHAKR